MSQARQEYLVQAVNAHSSMKEINYVVDIGSRVVIPPSGRFLFPRNHLSKLITVATAGVVVIENVDGDCAELFFYNPGEYKPFVGQAVRATGVDIAGNTITTTATGIYWYGGA